LVICEEAFATAEFPAEHSADVSNSTVSVQKVLVAGDVSESNLFAEATVSGVSAYL